MPLSARFLAASALSACLALLSACNGGGGTAAPAPATTTAPTYTTTPTYATTPTYTAAPATRAPLAPSTGYAPTGGGIVFAGKDLPLEQVLARSRSTGRPAMLYFATTWCGYCRKLERETLPSPEVGRHMAGYVNVEYGADTGVGRDLAQRYGVRGFPAFVRIDGSGNLMALYEGFDLPQDFVRRIPAPQ